MATFRILLVLSALGGVAFGGIPSHFYYEFGENGYRAKEMTASAFFRSNAEIALAKAAAKGDTNGVLRAIRQGADVNAIGERGMRPLFWALINRNFLGFKALLDFGANPNSGTANHEPRSSALSLAASLDESEFLKQLLARGAHPNARLRSTGFTALFTAMLYRKTNNIAILLEHGADLNSTSTNGATCLHESIRQGNFQMALFLYRLGADISPRDIWGFSAVDTMRKYEDRGVEARKDRSAYQQLLREMQKDRVPDLP